MNHSLPPDVHGLTPEEVEASRRVHGRNEVVVEEKFFSELMKEVFADPMLLLLVAASLLYFATGETGHGLFMLGAIVVVYSISVFQDSRSRKALKALRDITQPEAKVIRSGQTQTIAKAEIVVGDLVVAEEGSTIPADGVIIRANDFTVNESLLTGESLPVEKANDDPKLFQGTQVTSGSALFRVEAVGAATRIEQIGKSIEAVGKDKTPLEAQIDSFVKKITYTGLVVLAIVWLLNYLISHDALDSLLKALALGMSIVPEEIPVAFTTFMAIGAWKLMKRGIVVRRTGTVETLGSATVICLDKTGTITENRMSLAKVEPFEGVDANRVVELAMWASEPDPFDPMEVALHDAYTKFATPDQRAEYKLVHEYPLGGQPPMMTHVFQNAAGKRIIAAKGAPEAIMAVTKIDREKAEAALKSLTAEGFRVLGVAISTFNGTDYPPHQQELPFEFLGFVAFYDPPKKNIAEVFSGFYEAGIGVKILTGDNEATTRTIARQVGFQSGEHLDGKRVMEMPDADLQKAVHTTNIFTRMYPEAKLRVLKALKSNGEVVAMTGDGVNDGPALKAAHIGIAMGQRGSEVAKEVSSLVLTSDNLESMIEAIAIGRRIYSNLKKAVQYIISIHIPIILTVFIPLALGWIYPNVFTPVHVIFLELIMGPTCSIVYENEPIEPGTMTQKPRPFTSTFFNWKELSISIVQGLVITLATLSIYQLAVLSKLPENETRTMVFTTLISSNIFLTLVNRSFVHSIWKTMTYRNPLLFWILGLTVALTTVIFFVPPITHFFRLSLPTASYVLISIGAGALGVLWLEVVKPIQRKPVS